MTTQQLVHVDPKHIEKIDNIIDECGMIRSGQKAGIMAGLQLAAGVAALRSLITPEMMRPIMDLQGTPLGFRTDRDKAFKGPTCYEEEIVKECAIQAMLNGARLIGNEFNIIASNCYLTKEYFVRTMADMENLTDLVIEFGVPQQSGEKGALVPAKATWKYQGRRDHIERDVVRAEDGKIIADNRIAVRVNSGQGADAILGKAERKLRAQILSRITNTTFTDGDVSDLHGDVIVVPGSTDPSNGSGTGSSLNDKLRSQKAARAQAAAQASQTATPTEEPEDGPEAQETVTRATQQTKKTPAKPAEEDPPFELEAEQSTAVAEEERPDFSPERGEPVGNWHGRLLKAIKGARTEEELGWISEEVNSQAANGYVSGMRETDLWNKMEARHAELTGS